MDRERFDRIFRGGYVVQNPDELYWLVGFAEALNPTAIIEIGVEMGGTLKFWEEILPPGGLLIGVDVNPLTPERIDWPWRQSDRKVKLIIGDSIDPATVSRVGQALEGKAVDFLYVDGNHDLPHVSGDFRSYGQFVRSGGLVGFHDVGAGESGQFFDSLPGRKEVKNVKIGTGVWWKHG